MRAKVSPRAACALTNAAASMNPRSSLVSKLRVPQAKRGRAGSSCRRANALDRNPGDKHQENAKRRPAAERASWQRRDRRTAASTRPPTHRSGRTAGAETRYLSPLLAIGANSTRPSHAATHQIGNVSRARQPVRRIASGARYRQRERQHAQRGRDEREHAERRTDQRSVTPLDGRVDTVVSRRRHAGVHHVEKRAKRRESKPRVARGGPRHQTDDDSDGHHGQLPG